MNTIQHPPASDLDASIQVVGIGASAGGLKPLEALLRALPCDTGMAFVVVQHLSPTHPSLLAEILGRCTQMAVKEACEADPLVADRVYIIPPDHDLVLDGNRLRLVDKVIDGGRHLSVDRFFYSLASERQARAIGIVLSGSGEDGTLGCQALIEAGGYTLAQSPDEALYRSMPASVIAAGHATTVAPVEQMPALLLEHQGAGQINEAHGFDEIIHTLHEATGHDFTHYKRSTIERRIERRMALQRITEQASYVQYLKATPAELPLLFDELLINVTGFFRDPEAFDTLKYRVLKPLLEHKPDGYVLRAWVAGCASGEEAYSLAILLLELRAELPGTFDIQLYATDLDADAIRLARAGLYPFTTAQQVSPLRLRAWFNHEDSGYRVRSELRKLVVFAVHNVVSDPPFTRLDLLCCRNLLIYLGPRLQQQVIPAFHYALKPKGVLFLSPSESTGHHGTLFTPLDRRWKLYEVIKAQQPAAPTRIQYTLHATIKELQLSNAEHDSTNEDLQSANEELQSTIEELETSREELQSVNEELITVNAELQAKVEQLFDMQNDMKNLLDSVNVGAIFLDMQLGIRRFTREATHIYRLITRDIGRSLLDITSHLVNADLIEPAQAVLDTLIPYECEVHTAQGQCFLARIMPYRTLDNVIEGVVLTFHDITSRMATERSVEAARSLAQAVINTVREPLLVLDPSLRVVSASQSYYEIFKTSEAHTLNRPLLELGRGEWNIPALKDQLRTILERDNSFTALCMEQQFAGVGLLQLSLDGRRVVGDGIRPDLILLAMQINRRLLRGHDEKSTPA